MHYVVVYAKSEGRLLRVDEFADSRTALEERFHAERLHKDNSDVEVVVLSGDSKAAIERTHARYFHHAKEMMMSLGNERRAGGTALAGLV